MITVLTVVSLISGTILVLMYNYANPFILKNRDRERTLAIFKIFPEGKNYEKKKFGENVLFEIKDGNDNVLGYIFEAEGNGYQGLIKIMAGIDTGFKTLLGMEILESQETPGLGQEITEQKFKVQFRGLATSPEITYVKNKKPENPNEIQAITGATISSGAVVTILNERIKELRSKANN